MKKYITILSFVAALAAVCSCYKEAEENEVVRRVDPVTQIRILESSGGTVLTDHSVIIEYDAVGRVVRADQKKYAVVGEERKLSMKDLQEYDYELSTMRNEFGYIALGEDITMAAPVTYSLAFNGNGILMSLKSKDALLSVAYENGRMATYTSEVDDFKTVMSYTWEDGDLTAVRDGDFGVTFKYGTDPNPFQKGFDPIIFATTMFPDQASFAMTGLRNAHLPVAMHDDFFPDINFRYEYTYDDYGRVIQIDILGDDPGHSEDTSILIAY